MHASSRLAFLLILGAAVLPAQTPQAADPALLAQIRRIPAIDNHAHPPKLVAAGEKDDEFDALPCDPLEPTVSPLMFRPENPQYLAAWKDLWGYHYDDRAPAHVAGVTAAKARARAAHGDDYPAWVLGRLGIDVQFSNRVAMGRGLDDAHHRWVPFDDALLFPLDNTPLAAQTPDRRFFFSREDMLRGRYLHDAGASTLPATLGEYVARVVTPTLEHQKRQGAVAIKFETAYLRSLDFGTESATDAAPIYARYAHGGAPDTAEYRHLQDYLFRYIASEAGRLGLPVHIHTGAGCGGYFYLAGANPLLLEPVLNDASLRKTTFVLLHGGAVSYTPGVAYLMMKPNVYADLSQQTWMESAERLATTLRYWLEWYPEKVLFGTDLAPTGLPEVDWEEVGWQTNDTARRALAIALTGMMRDGEITRAQALEFARDVLRENAVKLYHLGKTMGDASTPGAVLASHEPHHHLVYADSTLRVLRVQVPGHDSTLLHEHDPDYFWIALGASDFVNARPGQPDANVTSADLAVHFTPGRFAHVARNPGDAAFNNITVELLGTQTNARNLCEAAVANQPTACDTSQSSTSGAQERPAFATDQLRVALAELQPGATLRPADGGHRTWLIALDTADTRASLVLSRGRWVGGVFRGAPSGWSLANRGRDVKRVLTVVELQ